MTDIGVWHVTEAKNEAIGLEDASTLDAITRELPEGYYSTFRTFEGGTRVLGLTAHLERLFKPVTMPDVDESFLRRQLSALLEEIRPREARVRAVMTKRGQVYIAIAPLAPLPGAVYENGVHVGTTELQREHPRLKSTSFVGQSDAERKHIAQEGIFEALLVKDAKILEGMTSNFFYIIRAQRNEERSLRRVKTKRAMPDATLYTARNGILLGVTRETVIEIARGRGLGVKYHPLQLDQVTAINEAFITSSSRGIVPVVRIDDAAIGQGRPGPITKELMAVYDSYVIEKAEKI